MFDSLWQIGHEIRLAVEYSDAGLESTSIFAWAFYVFVMLDLTRYLMTNVGIVIQHTFRGSTHKRNSVYESQPLVTAILAAKNESKTIAATLESLLATGYPNLEILVIDDGSTDRTFEVCRGYEEQGLIRLFRSIHRKGKSAALNTGLLHARGEYILPVDSDTVFEPDIIERILYPFRDPTVGAVCGNIHAKNWRTNLLTRVQSCEYLRNISLSRRFQSAVGILPIVSGAIGCYRRDVLLAVGGWESELGEDFDVSLKVRKLNMQLRFAPDAYAYTNVPTSLRVLTRQRLRWGKGYFRMLVKKHYSLFRPIKENRPNFFMALDNLIFQIVLPSLMILAPMIYFCVHTTHLSDHTSLVSWLALFLIGIGYLVFSFLSMCFAVALSGAPGRYAHLIFLFPLLPPYYFYLRSLRLICYLEEIFGVNYEDAFFPREVWESSRRW